jgi:hypothetical protein
MFNTSQFLPFAYSLASRSETSLLFLSVKDHLTVAFSSLVKLAMLFLLPLSEISSDQAVAYSELDFNKRTIEKLLRNITRELAIELIISNLWLKAALSCMFLREISSTLAAAFFTIRV